MVWIKKQLLLFFKIKSSAVLVGMVMAPAFSASCGNALLINLCSLSPKNVTIRFHECEMNANKNNLLSVCPEAQPTGFLLFCFVF